MKILTGTLFALLAGLGARDAQAQTRPSPLQGTWILIAADKRLPNGDIARDYGEHPKGRLMVDASGQYSLQIFRSDRERFGSDSKAEGSAEDFRSAVMGSSTHYGVVAIDERANELVFTIDGASFPNWEGTTQRRRYTLEGVELRYSVPPRADGSVPISVWRRVD